MKGHLDSDARCYAAGETRQRGKLPTVAITIHILEVYRNASLQCPHLAINSFVKSLCDLHGTPFCPYLRKQFSICFDVYLCIRNCFEQHVQATLKRNDHGWRLRHACPCCTHKLTGETELVFSMLLTMDGNDSLKHIQRRKTVPLDPGDGDTPVIGEPNERKDKRSIGDGYYVTREQVDRWSWDLMLDDAEEFTPCEDRWKNMADKMNEKTKRMYNETGGFLSFCRHGFVLTIIDMVQSGELSKYSLATVEALLEAFGPDIGGGYDIGCSFHGHAHNRLCQLHYLATYVKGLGLEDLKGGERFFSKSNVLAASIHHASIFHRKQKIIEFAKHMDQNETYQNLSQFLVNNYKQALNILNDEAAFVKQMPDQNVADISVFQDWLAEEKTYLKGLCREPLQESLTMEYWQKLKAWQVLTPATIGSTWDTTQSEETVRRHAHEVEAKDLLTVQNLEVQISVLNRWGPADKEWKEAAVMVGRRRYQRCLDALKGLVVARMFELTKMNMSQTGYKLHKHIGNTLKACSIAVRTALQNYNIAAQALSPPRPPLLWDDVEYAFLTDFDLLSDTRSDVRLRVWAKPAACILMDQYFKMEQAKEEITCLNVEIPRLTTYIRDEEAFLLQQEELLLVTNLPLSCQLRLQRLKRLESAGIHRNLQEWDRNPQEWDWNPQESAGMGPESTGIHRNGTGIHRNPQEWDRNLLDSCGIRPE
ncbi:hypothetical protein K443DRAFT_130861 [Laccaria amethystina LaAM-08-1]|uniref:CxC2-like cysteine cluster KDZ transposase-associated domain-containing protein n=1 Tax=Laccaria amethystina LaAM-08-1 TaxID=1095629 RepID=A0A0C9XHD2_9AGAR|nr:hypothetical protein K443DRAFT_130861 [Laccaria amethystina LaAM-08-1]